MVTLFFLIVILYFVPVVACLAYVKGNKTVNKWHCFNPKKWFSFLFGWVMSRFLKKHILEQLILRVYNDDICNACWINDKCSSCGCNRTKFLVPWESCDREDGEGNKVGWGDMILNENEYRVHREKYPVSITVKVRYSNEK